MSSEIKKCKPYMRQERIIFNQYKIPAQVHLIHHIPMLESRVRGLKYLKKAELVNPSDGEPIERHQYIISSFQKRNL